MLGEDLQTVLRHDYSLVGMDARAPRDPDMPCIVCDITDQPGVERIMREQSPWLVIHAAAYTDVDGCERDPAKAELVNAEGTRIIADACRACRSKLLYISTDYVFNGEKGSAYTENDLPQPLNAYGYSKLNGEKYVRELVRESLIVRTSWLFGRYGKNFVATTMEKAKQNQPLQVVDDQRGCPTSTITLATAIKRLVPAVFSAADPGNYGIYQVCNSGDCSWYEFAKTIVAFAKLPAEVMPVDSGKINRPAKRPRLSIMDTGRYENVTGDKICSWQDALRQYLACCA